MTTPDGYLLFHVRADVATEWADANPIVAINELAYDSTNKRLKIGDGVTNWNSLPWLTVSQATIDAISSAVASNTSAIAGKYTKPSGGIPATDLDNATQGLLNNSLQKSGNLSGLASASSARTNLGLGGAATLSVGTASGTVAAGDDARFTNTRTPSANSVTKAMLTANLIPYDYSFLAVGPVNTRAVGASDNSLGVRVPRAITLQAVFFRCATADASGNLVVELRKNGAQIAGTSVTIASGSQVAGSGVTGLSVALVAGDILTVQITAVGTTPGKGLVADITGAWT